MTATVAGLEDRRCPHCGGKLLWDQLKGVAYCDECWIEVDLWPESERKRS